MTLLELDRVSVEYRRRHQAAIPAVSDVSLAVERGGCVGVVGESGSGKSTLAKAIAGLVQPSVGQISFGGSVLPQKRSPEMRRRIQMVFQDPSSSLNPALNVARMLAEVLKYSGVKRELRTERTRALMEQVGLDESQLNKHPGQLSGGQRQRVAIARALATSPDLVVADEITSALDVSVQAGVLNLLSQLRGELGLTIMFISHDLSVVRQLCDRVAVMRRGQLVEEGETDRLFGEPHHPYTAALLSAVPDIPSQKG